MKFDKNIIVSIVMPTYNRAELISNAIDSVLKQEFNSWELLVIDNESTDNTKQIVTKYLETDHRIKYHFIKKSLTPGLSEYLNYGIKVAIGKYIARLDDDDEWCDNYKLTKQVNFLDENLDYNLVGGGAIMVDNNKKELYKFFKRQLDEEIRKTALFACPFWHSTVLFRKSIIDIIGGYKNIRFGEDWEFWLRIGRIGKFYNFKDYFSLYLNTGNNFSVNHQRFVGKTILRIIKDYRTDYPHYKKAYLLNYLQYLYSFSPKFIKNRTQTLLFFVKRNYF